MRYGVVIEKAEGNYSAYVPDLPGCAATGVTIDEVEREIREAIAFHLDGLREDGLPVPQPAARWAYAEAGTDTGDGIERAVGPVGGRRRSWLTSADRVRRLVAAR